MRGKLTLTILLCVIIIQRSSRLTIDFFSRKLAIYWQSRAAFDTLNVCRLKTTNYDFQSLPTLVLISRHGIYTTFRMGTTINLLASFSHETLASNRTVQWSLDATKQLVGSKSASFAVKSPVRIHNQRRRRNIFRWRNVDTWRPWAGQCKDLTSTMQLTAQGRHITNHFRAFNQLLTDAVASPLRPTTG